MRDFSVTHLPVASPDVGSSAVVAALPPEPTPPPTAVPPAGSLLVPPLLPGAETPVLRVPKLTGLSPADRDKAIRETFPSLPPLDPDPAAAGPAVTLAELEQLGLANNPAVRRAAADVEAARGRMIQAGLYPNPEIGYQADQINSGRGVQTRGQQGGYVAWQWITAGKLSIARLAEAMVFANAQVALRRAQIDVTVEVRRQYFAALVARQSVRATHALTAFSDEIYKAQLELLKAGELAGYEPLQSYVLAVQARGGLALARNRYVAAWRQLAAAVGNPGLPQAELAGRADSAVPAYSLDALREAMLANHTDIQTAQNSVMEARYRLRLAEVTPIPDIRTQVYIERDWSTPPYNTQVGVQSGGAIPVFNRNQGNRLAAKAEVARAVQDVARVQNELAAELARAWEAYAGNRTLVAFYRDHALPNQVRVYRGTFERFRKDPQAVNYNDVVVAQQTLATLVTQYLSALGSQWTAVADLTALSQQAELFPGGVAPPVPAPLEGLLAPPSPVEPPSTAAPPAPAGNPAPLPEPRAVPKDETK